ncbi:hypothetical protein [Sphingomonas ginsenosidivorax]|uniref:hypothetical protein n=1 Tax=Sphingomonas ginsenosidivorax TaxID=862135 RepID=UPI0018F5D2BD|nr:hypothetical protein [Sphingomonas ginsenosidivorax]
MTPDEPRIAPAPVTDDVIRRRQRGRARVMALLLGAFVILVFAISIAKIQAGMPHG